MTVHLLTANCKADLIAHVESLFGFQDDNQCDLNQYVRTYYAARDDETSMKCASIIAYANGTLTESVVTATIHVLYFLGVSHRRPLEGQLRTGYCRYSIPSTLQSRQRQRNWTAAQGLVSVSYSYIASLP